MQFMMIIKTSRKAESNPPQPHLIEQMDRYNDLLEAANVRVMAKGLYPDSEGVKIQFLNPLQSPIVTYGPFSHDQNQVAGFFIIDVENKDEALQWLFKAPDPQGFGEGEIELRQIR